jgi:hypothetical protein
MTEEHTMNSPASLAAKKRIRFLVMPGFQVRFMIYIICFAVFGIAVLYASNHFYYARLVAEGQGLGLAPDHIYFEFIEQQKSLLNTVFFSVSVVVFGGMIMAGLVLSHKIAGPVYRIQQYLKTVYENGAPDHKLKFRDKDFFPEVAELINALVEHYEEKKD